MDKLALAIFIFITVVYASSCVFVLTASKREVDRYCFSKIVDQSHTLSQRSVACSLKKYR